MNILSNVYHQFGKICNQVYATMVAGWTTRNLVDPIRASWARSIESYQAVPEVFKCFFEPFQADGREFPYTVLTPSYEGFIHRTTEKLICDFGNEIIVLERNGNSFDVKSYPLEGISLVRVRMILLDSSIKICGLTKQGVLASSTLRFNSVSDYLFTPILQRIRSAPIDPKACEHAVELEEFDPWGKLNYKFMNYARRSLLAGEKVIYKILQPEIRETVLKFLRKTYKKTISPTLACILTDRELITIKEEKPRGGEDRYGGIWDYIPLKKIETLSLKEKDRNLVELTIQLTQGTHLKYLFQISQKPEILQLQGRFRELVTA